MHNGRMDSLQDVTIFWAPMAYARAHCSSVMAVVACPSTRRRNVSSRSKLDAEATSLWIGSQGK
jgi:hypothetical protein